MKIENANLKIIKDSRGNDTLEIELSSSGVSVVDSVPAGKSRGAHEAAVIEPQKALEKFEEIKERILSADWQTQEEFDNFLISLDNTPNKQNLGANLILALSLAFARLKTKTEGIKLFQYIKNQLPTLSSQLTTFKLPRPIFNFINGGVHATNAQSKLDFQEFQVIPETDDFGLGLSITGEFYRKLKDFLEEKFGKENVLLGDEAGFSVPFQNDEEALDILFDFISEHSYPLRIGLDIAATQLYKEGAYELGGKKYSAEELRKYYLELINHYNLISIEDPFEEEDFESFAKLNADSNNISTNPPDQHESVLLITDDLTTTNPERLKMAIEKKAGNTILIKPNQIGTLSETLKVVKMAYENGWQTIVSHRSGETMDNFIADLAVGIGAWGLKAGAPGEKERLVKYERILEIGQKI